MGRNHIKVILNGRLRNGMQFNDTSAMIVSGKFLPEAPKSYKEIGTLSHNLGGRYSSSIMTVYKASDGTYRYSRYIDGSFYPMFGKIIL